MASERLTRIDVSQPDVDARSCLDRLPTEFKYLGRYSLRKGKYAVMVDFMNPLNLLANTA